MRFGDTIYYCKKKEGVEQYEAPIPIVLRPNYFSLMPASGYSDVMVYGEDVNNRYRDYAPLKIWGTRFTEGDKFYIDYKKPIANEENGATANAEIKAVLYDNLFVKLEIRRLVSNVR